MLCSAFGVVYLFIMKTRDRVHIKKNDNREIMTTVNQYIHIKTNEIQRFNLRWCTSDVAVCKVELFQSIEDFLTKMLIRKSIFVKKSSIL